MAVLIVLGGSILVARVAGYAGVEAVASWAAATCVGMAVMLIFTASARFNRMRHDLVRMVPSWVPHPREVVFFTGVCEILGAIG